MPAIQEPCTWLPIHVGVPLATGAVNAELLSGVVWAAAVDVGGLVVAAAVVDEGGPEVPVELMGWDDGKGEFVTLIDGDVAVPLLVVAASVAVVALELAVG